MKWHFSPRFARLKENLKNLFRLERSTTADGNWDVRSEIGKEHKPIKTEFHESIANHSIGRAPRRSTNPPLARFFLFTHSHLRRAPLSLCFIFFSLLRKTVARSHLWGFWGGAGNLFESENQTKQTSKWVKSYSGGNKSSEGTGRQASCKSETRDSTVCSRHWPLSDLPLKWTLVTLLDFSL